MTGFYDTTIPSFYGKKLVFLRIYSSHFLKSSFFHLCLKIIFYQSRWKRDSENKKVKVDEKYILEFVAILRGDTKEWAIPGVSHFCSLRM